MKINVLTVDKQITTLNVDLNDLVGHVKDLLKVEGYELSYDGKEVNNDDKLSDLGVREGDMIVVVSDSAPISSSSTTEPDHNSDGPAMNLAAFQQKIRHNTNLVAQLVQCDPEFAQAIAEDDHYRLEALLMQRHQQREQSSQMDGKFQGITNFENVPRNDNGEVCLAFLAEKEISPHMLDEEKHSKQESVRDDKEVNEEVKSQKNGGSTHAEENDHYHDHSLNSSDKESSSTSIEKVGSGNHNDSNNFDSFEHSKGTEVKESELLDSSLSPSIASPFSPNPLQTTTKGHGLKKWRRIRREFTNDPSSNQDSTKVLKRGSANISDVKKPTDESVSSTNAFVKSPGCADLFSNPIPSSKYEIALGTTFSAGAEDSEDRSSKSSTAASVPKYRHDVVKAAGNHQREKHRGKTVSGRHLAGLGQRIPPVKGYVQADPSKKPRGENVDKENSLSSMESDSRSYSSLFVRGASSVNSDQVQSGRSANYNEEDDQQASEVQSSKEPQAGHGKNGNLSPECSAELSSSANMGKSKDHQVSRDCEPLLNSILLLQSAQEALEREVQMFKKIGMGVSSLCGDSGKTTGLSAYSMFVGSEACDQSYNSGAQFGQVQTLERQLDEAQISLKEKDSKLLELEKMTKCMNMESAQAEFQRSLQQQMEDELEAVFKLKLEAQVQNVVMTGSRKDLSVLVDDQIKLLRDLTFEQSRRLMADVGKKASILQGQKKVDKLYTDITEVEEVQKMQSRVRKYSSYLLIQLALLVVVGGIFILRWLPKSAIVVPT